MPFLNAMNDFYLKNLSDRIKSVFEAKAKAGHKLTGAAPYGFMRDPDNHTMLIVDEYAAGIVVAFRAKKNLLRVCFCAVFIAHMPPKAYCAYPHFLRL